MRRLSLLPQLLAAPVVAGSLFLFPASMAEVQKIPRATVEEVREAGFGGILAELAEGLIKLFKRLPPRLQIIIAGSGTMIVVGGAIVMISYKSSDQEERSEDKNQNS